MKLDRDCVRDFLLALESLEPGENLTSSNYHSKPQLASYNRDVIIYTAEKLDEAGFINVKFMPVLSGDKPFIATSLTWHGHQFLDNIRDDGVWKETKKVASKVASVSLNILADIAASIMKRALGLE